MAQPQFNVDTEVDAPDAVPGDGICVSTLGGCTLRAAIEENNSGPGGRIINLPRKIYTLTLGLVEITSNVDIRGETSSSPPDIFTFDKAHINANRQRGFIIGEQTNVSFSNLVIFDGYDGRMNGLGGAMYISSHSAVSFFRVDLEKNEANWVGGAMYIASLSQVNMEECKITYNNSAYSTGEGLQGYGGAIRNHGTLILNKSTFTYNAGSRGGAISNHPGAWLQILNCTFSNNKSARIGGAIWNQGDIRISYSTFYENESRKGGGAIYNELGKVEVANSILAGNIDTRSSGSADYSPDVLSNHADAIFTTYQGNIFGTVNYDVWKINDPFNHDLRYDQKGIDNPQLESLYPNGGITWTHEPLKSSPAIDKGTGTTGNGFFQCPLTDQRGVSRRIEGSCDVGAYEVVPTSGVVEAEDAEYNFGLFEMGTDAEASGGEFVQVPNGTGDLLSGPHEIHSVRFEFYVDDPGTYNIQYSARGASASDNSFWVKVNESDYYLTDFSPTSQFGEYLVTDRGTGSEENPEIDPVTVYLSRGVHKVNFYLREDGAQLDRVLLQRVFSSPQNLEVESSALLFGDFMVANDPAASNSQYVLHPASQPDITDGPDDAHKIVQNITVDQAGTYLIRSHVWAEFDSKNSFYVKVDGLPEDGYLWDMTENNFSFGLDYVSDRGNGSTGNPEQDPVEIYLSEGEHIIEVFAREAGTGIDNIGLELKQDSSGGFVCEGDCLNAEPIVKDELKTLNTTGDRWYVVNDNINGWQAAEMAGRSIFVNGVQVQPGQIPLPAKVNGKYYFHFTAGEHPWASWSFWNW